MKTKKFNKRLGLNKKTIANLDKSDMNMVYGGVWPDTKVLTICITNCMTDCACYPTVRPSKCVC
jgi:hypothetical protein